MTPDSLPPRSEWRVSKPTARPLPPSADGLLEEGVDALPVRITIVQDGVVTGWDDGALGFEENAFWFSGRATSFRVVAVDILPGAFHLSRHEAVTDGEALRQGFPLRHLSREVWVRVEVLNIEERKPWEDEMELIRGVKRLRQSPLVLSGESGSEYPPLRPRPGMLQTQATIRRRKTMRIVGGALFALGLCLSGLKSLSLIGTALVTVGFLLGLPSEGLPLDEERRLRRFDEEEASETGFPLTVGVRHSKAGTLARRLQGTVAERVPGVADPPLPPGPP